MTFERVTGISHPMYDTAMKLYRISFPPHEQREPDSQQSILRDAAYHFSLAYDEAVFVGLVLYWETDDFIYVEHFCILPEMRSRRYGQRILEKLSEQGKVIILEIDPPVDEISVRRKGFYECCGFAENPYHHVHPPYHRGNSGHELVVMSSLRQISSAEYENYNQYLNGRVMHGCF